MRSINVLIWCLIFYLFIGCAQEKNIQSMTFSGTLEMTEYSVGAPVAGTIANVFVEEEQNVNKGQLIAQLEHFQQAKKDFERAAALVDSGGVSRQEYEHEKLAMEDQEAVSPVDGVVLIKVREPGEVVAAGAPIVVIGEYKDMWIKVFIPENLVAQVSINQKTRIKVDGIDKEINGHVSYIATEAEFTPRNIQSPEERATQTFAVKVILDENTSPIHPGVTADVNFY